MEHDPNVLEIQADLEEPATDQTVAAVPSARPSVWSAILRGSAWTFVQYGVSIVLRVLNSVILSRLLFPEAFGLTSILTFFFSGLEMFSDLGLVTSVIRNKRGDDPDFLNTAWTLQVLRGLLLWTCSVLLAWPFSLLYGKEMLYLIPVCGLAAVIAGFNSTSIFTCSRHIRLGRMTVMDLATQAVTLAATVSLAYRYRSVWALLAGGLVGAVAKLVLSHTFLPGIPSRFRWERESLGELIGFGKKVFLNTVITFFSMQADRILLGALVSKASMGVYAIGSTVAQMPRDLTVRLIMTVFMPSVSRVLLEEEDDRAGAARRLRAIRRPIVLGLAPFVGLLIGGGPFLIRLVYPTQYAGAGAVVSLLAVGIWFQLLQATYGSILIAKGAVYYLTAGLVARLVFFAAVSYPAFHAYGLLGIAAVTGVSDLFSMLPCAFGVRRFGFSSYDVDLQSLAVTALSALAAWAVLGY